MKNIAIIGETEDVYYIDKDVIKYLSAYLYDGDIMIGTGYQYFMNESFDVVYVDGVKYDWVSGGIMPSTNNIQVGDFICGLTDYQRDIINKLINGSIASVSEYKRDEKSYQKRMREKKIERIL